MPHVVPVYYLDMTALAFLLSEGMSTVQSLQQVPDPLGDTQLIPTLCFSFKHSHTLTAWNFLTFITKIKAWCISPFTMRKYQEVKDSPNLTEKGRA